MCECSIVFISIAFCRHQKEATKANELNKCARNNHHNSVLNFAKEYRNELKNVYKKTNEEILNCGKDVDVRTIASRKTLNYTFSRMKSLACKFILLHSSAYFWTASRWFESLFHFYFLCFLFCLLLCFAPFRSMFIVSFAILQILNWSGSTTNTFCF